MSLSSRAAAHAALGDTKRLAIVDALAPGDLTVAELGELVDIPGNLLAHHLDVLDDAGLIIRHVSEGDRRRRYVSLQWDQLPSTPYETLGGLRTVVFVCTQNSARSQFAAAVAAERLTAETTSAGSRPAVRVHPLAIAVASEFGVDLTGETPGGYERITTPPDLVISVCDRAREGGLPQARRTVHWSVPDPTAAATKKTFRIAFSDIARRIDHLAAATRQEGA